MGMKIFKEVNCHLLKSQLQPSPLTLVVFLIFSSSLLALGNEELKTNTALPPNTTSLTGQLMETGSQYHGKLRSEATKYSSNVSDKKLNQSVSVGTSFRWSYDGQRSDMAFDFMAEHFVDWNQSQFSVKELYWGRPFQGLALENDRAQLSLGRKLEYWSKADEEWSLGLWQPLQVFDGLRPEQQGLTGVFWKHESGLFEVLGYSSPIFIPTMGPSVKNENGNLSSNSRWFRSPSQTFRINNKERQIVYSVNTPEVGSLIAKPGAGARIAFNSKGHGVWGSAGAAYKPINDLLLKYEKKLITDGVNEDTGNAKLYPVVGYHNLLSVDLGYRGESYELVGSFIADKPKDVQRTQDDPYVMQKASDSKIYSWTLKNYFDYGFPTHLSLSYLRIDGGDLRDFDALGVDQGAVFSSRFKFSHAVSGGGAIEGRIFDRKLISKLKYLRDFDQRASLWNGQFDFYPMREFVVFVGFDILGGDRKENDQTATGFLNEFRANDRAFAGVNYEF